MEDVLQVERNEGYAVLSLNRPQARNALSRALRQALAEAVVRLEGEGVQVLILTGAGSAFCAGVDLKELSAGAQGTIGQLDQVALPDVLARFSGASIAAINGAAITGGFELALGCDVLLASEEARFADTHARVGILPMWGLSQKLSRIIGPSRAKEMSLSGNFIDARQALAWGLVNRVVPAQELLPAARALAQDMLSLAPGMLTAMKRLIDGGSHLPLGEALAFERREAGAANRKAQQAGMHERTQGVLARGRAQQTRTG